MKINKKNLVKLRDGLLGVPDEFFCIKRYRSEYSYNKDFVSLDDCGTVGCALGWAPFMKGLEFLDSEFYSSFNNYEKLDFDEYSERLFGMRMSIDNPSEWDWVFGSEWETVDNTPLGVVFRIEYLFDNNMKAPCDFNGNRVRTYTKDFYSKYQEAHDGQRI